MKSWKEEKLHESTQESKTLQEFNKPYTSDYEIDNYIKAHRYARRVFRASLQDIYDMCCGPESKYHLDADIFEGMTGEAFTDASKEFSEILKILEEA